jgi:phosphoglycolate phosphatase
MPTPAVRFRAVIFDLDGTLLDTLADIAFSANAVLQQLGLSGHAAGDYRQFIGEGVARLFEKALPAERRDRETIERCVEGFGTTYGANWKVRSRPYEGIPELLDALTATKTPMAVLSNKPQEFTVRCVEHYFSSWEFAAVFGQRDGIPRKPDPAGALEIVERLQVSREQVAYLGDSSIDMQTAQNAGLFGVGAAWGFRSVEELRAAGASDIIDKPQELLRYFGDSAGAR